MAIHAHSTTAPTGHPRLLRGGGTTPCAVLTSDEVVALTADAPARPRDGRGRFVKGGQLVQVSAQPEPKPELPPEPLFPAADHARVLHLRRELHQALDHGFALLDALDLSPLALDVIDDAITALDALDGDTDREDDDREHDTADAEPSLASPERHPNVPYLGHWSARYVSRDRQDTQARWADGSRQDTEGDITDVPHDGDGEDLEAEPNEPVLGATEKIDQTGWGETGTHDREFDATDCIDRQKPREQVWASVARRDEMAALRRRAQALRFRSPVHRDPDRVTPIGPGMMSWGGPSICNVSSVSMRVVVVVVVVGEAST